MIAEKLATLRQLKHPFLEQPKRLLLCDIWKAYSFVMAERHTTLGQPKGPLLRHLGGLLLFHSLENYPATAIGQVKNLLLRDNRKACCFVTARMPATLC